MDEYLGIVKLFAGNFAPRGWAFCDGSLLSINQNTALFSILGTTYGGNGQTTFGLPDLRGRVAIGAGMGPGHPTYTLGQLAGNETTSILASNLPPHTHPFTPQAYSDPGNTDNPSNAFPASTGSLDPEYRTAGTGTNSVNMAPQTTGANGGGGQPISVVQPYQALNYIICTLGIFPTRN